MTQRPLQSPAQPVAQPSASPIEWAQDCSGHGMIWHSINQWPSPQRVLHLQQAPAAKEVLKLIRQGTHILWEGDFHQGRQLLQTLKRRLTPTLELPADSPMPETFHKLRLRKSQQTQALGQILVRVERDWSLSQRRAPQIRPACLAAWPALAVQTAAGPVILDAQANLPAPLVMPMTQLQGMMSAYQWQLRGVPITTLQQTIYPQYGVFAPTRQEYLALMQQAPLPAVAEHAIDIGTGTGVLAALLAQRGVNSILAIDMHPAALACAQYNVEQLGLTHTVKVQCGDLLQNAPRADLLVCNPPWLPGTVRSPLDAAVYDPDSRMLRQFLAQAPQHLNPGGQAWLIMSDLAERLGLRSRAQLLDWIHAAGLTVLAKHDTHPTHAKATNQHDPLSGWRSQEVTSLWQLSLDETV